MNLLVSIPATLPKPAPNGLGDTTHADHIKPSAMVVSGSATSISKSSDGHFWTEARVNSSSVKFLVDTGASVVALTPLDAQKAGVVNLQTL